MNQPSYVGIDVSAQTLEVASVVPGSSIQVSTFANTSTGHRQLLKRLTKQDRSARVCLEATGTYSLGVALALHHHARTQVMMVNPKAIKNYAGATMKRAKTDAVDAQLILDYSQRMPFVLWQPPSDKALQIQAIARRMHQLTVEKTRETNRLHADSYRCGLTDRIARDINVNIRHLERRIAQLEKDGVALVRSVPDLSEKLDRLLSVKGIAQTSALRILAELAVLPDDMKPPPWVAFAGIDPRAKESGSSVHPPRKITKMGHKYLRASLYMPAIVAMVHQPNVKAFYDKLIAAGKKPMPAIVAVMRKRLHAIWGLWKYNQDFDGQKFYKIAA